MSVEVTTAIVCRGSSGHHPLLLDLALEAAATSGDVHLIASKDVDLSAVADRVAGVVRYQSQHGRLAASLAERFALQAFAKRHLGVTFLVLGGEDAALVATVAGPPRGSTCVFVSMRPHALRLERPLGRWKARALEVATAVAAGRSPRVTVLTLDPAAAADPVIEKVSRGRLRLLRDPLYEGLPADWQLQSIEHAPDGARVLFFGSLSRRKGTLDMLEAARQVKRKRPDCRIELLGSLPTGPDRPEIEAAISAAVADGVATAELGRFSTGTLQERLADATAVALPYRNHHGSSGALVNCVAARVPVVVPPRGLMADEVRQYALGEVCESDDIEGVCSGLAKLIESPDRYRRHMRRDEYLVGRTRPEAVGFLRSLLPQQRSPCLAKPT
ncbi:MAG: glycosyltransferase [Actinomycetota bacterium]